MSAKPGLLFELSEADLSYALELHDEKHLQSLIATLPDTTVRALLLQAATHHAPTAKRVLAAAPTEPLVGSAANATPPTRLPDSPPTPPERTRAARDSFDVLRSSLSLDGNRGAHQLTISGVVLDSNDYFATKAREAIRVLNGVRRRDALASLVREINVMIDLGHGLFAMRAIVAVLDVVTNRSAMDDEVWRDVISFEGPLPLLENALRRASEVTPPAQCKEVLPAVLSLCERAELQGVGLLSPTANLLRRRASLSLAFR